MTDRFSPLHRVHLDAGASFTDFASWQMPVSYGSDLAEHHAVRSAAGLFDLSHMAEILVSGPDAPAFLDYALAGRLSATDIWQAKYSLLLDEAGGIVDDVVVYRLDEDQFFIVANAGNRETVVDALRARTAGFDALAIMDVSDDYALVAVQGPRSREILAATAGITELGTPLDQLRYYRATDAFFEGLPLLIARTGYTGEDGFELYVQTDAAAALWTALTTAGEPFGLEPAGLASRDTLRLEAGMPLYGHELGLETFPVQARLGRVIALNKEGDFVGRSAIETGPAEDAPVLVGLVMAGRRAGRAGYGVYVPQPDGVAPEAEPIGTVTSGALSPSLGHPIAMAYIQPSFSDPGTALAVDVRGTRISATVVALPFYTRPTAPSTKEIS